MTEHSFHGIHFLLKKGESVTYVSGTFCYLCVGSLTFSNLSILVEKAEVLELVVSAGTESSTVLKLKSKSGLANL